MSKLINYFKKDNKEQCQDESLLELTVQGFLNNLREDLNTHQDIMKIAYAINQVKNKKIIAAELNYEEAIDDLLDSFKIAHNFSNPDFEFNYKKEKSKLIKWSCYFGYYYKLKITHIPTDLRIGKRIEVIFNENAFEIQTKYDKVFKHFTLQRLTKELSSSKAPIIRVQFEDPKHLNNILLRLNEQIGGF